MVIGRVHNFINIIYKMKSDYFTIEIRYPNDVRHKPVNKQDIRHSIKTDNPGVTVKVESIVKPPRRKGVAKR